jgi:Tfp pilus assembly protein PilF
MNASAPAESAACEPIDLSIDSRRHAIDALLILLLVAGTFALFARTGRFDFINYDDPAYVYENPHARAGLSGSNLAWAFSATAAGNWHPLTWLSLMTDVSVFGARPGGMHLVNAALHALNAGLLFWTLRWTTGARWPSAWTAAIFALHPLHVESVAWISERKDVLSTLLWLLCTLAYVWYSRKRSAWRYAAVLFLLALGLMAKPMLVTLPFVFLLLDYWPLARRGARQLILEKLPMIALVLASAFMTYHAQSAGNAVQSEQRFPLILRVENAAISYVSYLSKTFVPRGLSIYYPHPAVVAAGDAASLHARALGAAALLVAITVVAISSRKRYPWLIVGWLWYLGTLVPVIGIVQVGSQAMADRYTYVPMIGILIAIAWTASDVSRRSLPALRPVVITLATTSVAACAVLAWRQIGYWRDSETLFRHALDVNPDNPAANNNLATILASRGQLSEAADHFRRAIAATPDNPLAHRNLARVYAQTGNIDAAISELAEALRLSDTAGISEPAALAFDHNLLGRMLLSRGRRDEAIVHLRRATELEPGNPKYRADWEALER